MTADRPPIEGQSAARLEGVSKSYGSRTLLRKVDLVVNRGEILGVMGPSGEGKSTLLRVIAGLVEPDEGVLEVAGRAVFQDGGYTDHWKELRRSVGMIFQQYTLWPHMNVYQNLTLAPKKVLGDNDEDLRPRVEEALRRVGMLQHLHSRVNQLSGGERQRVAIARALMMRPQVLLCDEITSALDAPVAHEVLGILTELATRDGIASIIVTHDLSFALHAVDRLMFIQGGRMSIWQSADAAVADAGAVEFQQFLAASHWVGKRSDADPSE